MPARPCIIAVSQGLGRLWQESGVPSVYLSAIFVGV